MKKTIRKIIYTVIISALIITGMPQTAYASKQSDAYQLTTDIVYTYKMKEMSGIEDVREKLSELKTIDESLGLTWETVMNYWIYANTDQEVNEKELPDNLPEDESLCIIVLGFQLGSNGEMSEELIGRCETALDCAKQYPKAYIAVTGGGTSVSNKTVTEAGQMADWFIEKGIDKDRIIIEDKSMTTEQNAEFLGQIIINDYPEITSAVIVTSNYHVPLGCLLFRAYFLFDSYKNGSRKVEVLSNAGFIPEGEREGDTIKQQAYDLWSLAEYMEATE